MQSAAVPGPARPAVVELILAASRAPWSAPIPWRRPSPGWRNTEPFSNSWPC